MGIFEKINHLQRVWGIALPHLAEPSVRDVARWCPYGMDAVETAILRAANRFSIERVSSDFDVVRAYKYVTATARAINDEGTGIQPCDAHTETMSNDTDTVAPDFESLHAATRNPIKEQAERLLRIGLVTRETTFGELEAILAADAANEITA